MALGRSSLLPAKWTPSPVAPALLIMFTRAPMWINRELFMQHLHHIDFRFAPFQFDDYELCARTWLSGLQVGWYDAGFRSLTAGGMRLWNNALAKEQNERNGHLLYELYAGKKEEISRRVAESRED